MNNELTEIIENLKDEIKTLSKDKRKILRKYVNKSYYNENRKKETSRLFCEHCNKTFERYYYSKHCNTDVHLWNVAQSQKKKDE